MTNPEPSSIDPAAAGELGREFAKVDKWFGRTQRPGPEPAPDSILAADDAALDPYQLSHAVVAALSTAVDHIHALRSLIVDAHVVHTYAPFTLLRAALENAATAVWLLAPSDQDQRVLRRLRLRWAEVHDETKVRALLRQPGTKTREDHKDRLQGIARNHGLSQDQIAMVTASPIGYAKLVGEAAEAVPTSFGPLVEPSWMVGSGIPHGRMWAKLMLLDLAETRAPVNAVHSLRMTSSDVGLLTITQTTASMIGYGWYLFDRKRKKSRPTI